MLLLEPIAGPRFNLYPFASGPATNRQVDFAGRRAVSDSHYRCCARALGSRGASSSAEEVGVGEGSAVDLSVREGVMVVKPARGRKYRLNELLRKVAPKNMHGEVGAGAPVGREIR